MQVGSKVKHRTSSCVYEVVEVHDDGTFTGMRDDGRIRHIQRPEFFKEAAHVQENEERDRLRE